MNADDLGGREVGDNTVMTLFADLGVAAMATDLADELPPSDKATLSPDDLAACLRVICALDTGVDDIHKQAYRDLRAAITRIFTTKMAAKLFDGGSLNTYVKDKLIKKQAKIMIDQTRHSDQRQREALRKRNARRNHLQELSSNALTAPLYTQMLAAEAAGAEAAGAEASVLPAAGAATPAADPELGPPCSDGSSSAADLTQANTGTFSVASESGLVTRRINCYICKKNFFELHHFYEYLCPSCAAFNWERRVSTRDLTGRVALVTGGRVKIGFEICLLLLRAGAAVIVTTRFPKEAALRYTKEADHATWGHRLHVYALDLRDLQHVERFCAHLDHTLPRLDIIINNACQTVRRPTGYYTHLLRLEGTPHDALPAAAQAMLPPVDSLFLTHSCRVGSAAAAAHLAPADASALVLLGADDTCTGGLGGVARSAALSQVPVVADDELSGASVLPQGQFDINGQQVDTRRVNSWRQRLGEVATGEAVECMAINALSPFIINGQLRALMQRTDPALDKYIVNVTAMEGVFYRIKQPMHPHTNMAKSALNQMVVTSARDYAQQNIFMTAVDTGWVNDENPVHMTAQKERDMHFAPPLDEVDGAARVVDPIFNGKRQFGVFLKNYYENEW